jgi:hypothetical protein
MKEAFPGLDTVEPHALPSVFSAREKEEREEWIADSRDWRNCYQKYVNKNLCGDSFAAKILQGDDLASEENDIKLEVGKEQDENLAGPVLRSSGEPILPKDDGWRGDQDDEVEDQEEQKEEADEQEELLSENSVEDEEDEPTSVLPP